MERCALYPVIIPLKFGPPTWFRMIAILLPVGGLVIGVAEILADGGSGDTLIMIAVCLALIGFFVWHWRYCPAVAFEADRFYFGRRTFWRRSWRGPWYVDDLDRFVAEDHSDGAARVTLMLKDGAKIVLTVSETRAGGVALAQMLNERLNALRTPSGLRGRRTGCQPVFPGGEKKLCKSGDPPRPPRKGQEPTDGELLF